MKSLKGLVLKDLYVIKCNGGLVAYCLIFGLVFTLISLSGAGKDMGISGTIIQHGIMQTLCMSMVISTFAYDKQAHWEPYMLTMPLSRGEAVWSKYISSGIFTVLATLYSLAIDVLLFAVGFRSYIPWTELLIAFGVAIFTCGFVLPLIIHFGPEKFRMMLIVVSIIQFGLLGIVSSLALHPTGDTASSPAFRTAVVGGTVLVGIGTLILSRLIAKNIFCKKEF